MKPLATFCLLAPLVLCGCTPDGGGTPLATETGPTPRQRVYEVGPLHLDRIFHSMQGPLDLAPVDTSDLDWVLAYRSEVIDDDNGEKMPEEFFCHSQLQLQNNMRLMVAATGAEAIEFPPGFAMPVSQIVASQPPAARGVRFLGMALNNHAPRSIAGRGYARRLNT